MARRAAAPVASPANQAGRTAAQAIKKIPKAILWIFGVFVLIGAAMGTVFGFIGSLLHDLSDGTIPGFGTFFQIGFILGLGGAVILYFRFAGFEDMQESGRAFISSLTIGVCAAVAFTVFLPMFGTHNTLRSLFIGGVAIAAIMAVANIFLKDDYLRVVTWGAMLAAAALIVLFAVKATDGKGFDIHIKWPWSSSSEVDHTPKDVWLSRQNPVLYFDNVSWETSDTYHVSSASKRLDWEFAESSACGNVLVNGRYLLRNLCPGRPGERIMLEKSVLFPGENTAQFQFIGKGMKGKVIATW